MNLECPLCGSKECNMTEYNEFVLVACKTYDVGVNIHKNIIDNNYLNEQRNELLNLIVEKLLQKKLFDARYKWHFYYDPHNYHVWDDDKSYINLAKAIESYPDKIVDMANRILLNLSLLYPKYGQEFQHNSMNKIMGSYFRVYFGDEFNNLLAKLDMLSDFGYIKSLRGRHQITVEGWKQIDRLKKGQEAMNQGFIAMSFDKIPELDDILEAFKESIDSAGYKVSIISEKEHNNQIIPEIIYEIRQSKFVVVDATFSNLGAYYEAGFAAGLGKPVIVCCRQDVLEGNGKYVKDGKTIKLPKPHFDISQKKMVTWNTKKELVENLTRRIKATVY